MHINLHVKQLTSSTEENTYLSMSKSVFFFTDSIAYCLHEVSFDTSALPHFYRNVCLIKVHQKNDLLRHVRRYNFLLKELCPAVKLELCPVVQSLTSGGLIICAVPPGGG